MSRVLMFATLSAGGIVSLAAAEHQEERNPRDQVIRDSRAQSERRDHIRRTHLRG